MWPRVSIDSQAITPGNAQFHKGYMILKQYKHSQLQSRMPWWGKGLSHYLIRAVLLLLCLMAICPPLWAISPKCVPDELLIDRSAVPAKRIRAIATTELANGQTMLLQQEARHAILLWGRGDGEQMCRKLKRSRRMQRITASNRGAAALKRRITCSCNHTVQINRAPNDEYYDLQWGAEQDNDIDLDLETAWNLSTGSSNVVVATIDTGIDYNHYDLQNNIWHNPREIAGNGVDDDHNGYVDDIHGINAITNSGNPSDDNGHGTHVAGIVGAVGNNSQGVAGVNWSVKLIGVKILDATGSGTEFDAIKGIEYVTALRQAGNNVVLSNNSWGGDGYSSLVRDAIISANNAGVLFIAAAGNASRNNDTTPTYPANYNLTNIISVAAIDSNGTLATFSNYGANTVDIAAPGVDVPSTYITNDYAYMSGTSMAAPYVSGVLSLLASYAPNYTSSQLKLNLLSNAHTLTSLTGKVSTRAIPNAHSMLSSIEDTPPNPAPTPPDPNLPGGDPEEITPVSYILSGSLMSKHGTRLPRRLRLELKNLRANFRVVARTSDGGRYVTRLNRKLRFRLRLPVGEYSVRLRRRNLPFRLGCSPRLQQITVTEDNSNMSFGVWRR